MNFIWKNEITKVKYNDLTDIDRNSWVYCPPSYEMISCRKLRQAIETYGVDTRDKLNMNVLEAVIDFGGTHNYIDVIMRYKPNFVVSGYVFNPTSGDILYILRKILENDTEYKYNKYPYRHGRVVYNNLLQYAKSAEYRLICLYRDDGREYSYQHQESKVVKLLSDHMDKMMKEMTLFQFMLCELDDENPNKKRRFY